MTEQTVLALITCQTYPEPSDNLENIGGMLGKHGRENSYLMRGKTIRLRRFYCFCAHGIMPPNPKPSANGWNMPGRQGQRFINPPELMAWNMEKTYLCDLAARGAQVIPVCSFRRKSRIGRHPEPTGLDGSGHQAGIWAERQRRG